MMRDAAVVMLACLCAGAAAARSLDTVTTVPSFTIMPAPPPPRAAAPPGFTPAPMPNLDAAAPAGPRDSKDAQLSPGFFQRANQYRGDGYSAGSSAQAQEDRRAQPGAGVNLRVPLQ